MQGACWRRLGIGAACRTVALLALLVLAGCGSGTGQSRGVAGGATPSSTPRASAPTARALQHVYPYTLDDIASIYVSHMSLDQELGQLFIVTLDGTSYNADNVAMIAQMHAGGMLLYAANMTSQQQTRAVLAAAQAQATFPLLTITDEEGGLVDRLQQFDGPRPSASEIGASGAPSYATSQGKKAGLDLRAFGFNTDFAPDVDVQLVNGPDQYTRTFGSTPGAVTTMAGAYLSGLQGASVVGCLKHFPGLGAATSDAHLDLPVINRSRQQIESVELAPYRQLIATGQVGMVMVTDLLMPALDPNNPAEVSPAIVTGILRQELGYDGVVTTDDLIMQGIADRYALPEAGVRSILAGDDMLLGARNADQMGAMVQALRDALQSGRLTKARIDQSVRRILVLKMRAGMIPVPANIVPVAPLGAMSPHTVVGPVVLNPKQ